MSTIIFYCVFFDKLRLTLVECQSEFIEDKSMRNIILDITLTYIMSIIDTIYFPFLFINPNVPDVFLRPRLKTPSFTDFTSSIV